MKGLTAIPQTAELQSAYSALQQRPERVTVEELALWSQWARFDPRLGEQWVAHVGAHWRNLPSGRLNATLRALPWPAAAGPLLEQTLLFVASDPREMEPWVRSALHAIPAAPYEQYFIGTRAIGGQAMFEDARLALQPYRAWGYLSREILVNKARSGGRTLLPPRVRRSVLNELLENRARLRVQEYRAALDGWVSPRQAEKDLAQHPWLEAVGQTRGRVYVVKRTRRGSFKKNECPKRQT